MILQNILDSEIYSDQCILCMNTKVYIKSSIYNYTKKHCIYIYLCNNQHKSDVVEIEKGQINDVLLQSGLLTTQPLWEAH